MSSTLMCGVRWIPPHDCHRDFAVLYETPPMHAALHERATAALLGLLPFTVGARSWRVTVKSERAAHLLFVVIHRRRRRCCLGLFARQAHPLALIRLRFWFVTQVDHPVRFRRILIGMTRPDSQ
jgi:hypothetical protein